MLSASSTLVVSSNKRSAMVNTGVLAARAVLLLTETPWILTLESDVAAAEMSGPLMLRPALLFALALLVEVIAELAGIGKGLAAWVFWRKQCDVAKRKLEWASSSKYWENAIPRFPFGAEMPDAVMEQRWGFLSPWCNVLLYHIHYRALDDDNDGDVWSALQVILPTRTDIYGEYKDDGTFQIEFQNTREALAVLAAVARVDYHAYKYLLTNHCGVDVGKIENVEDKIQVHFVLLMEHHAETDLVQLCGVAQRRAISAGYFNSLQRIAAMDCHLKPDKPGFDIEIPVRVIFSSTTVFKANTGPVEILLSIQNAERLIHEEWESYNWSLENQPVDSGQLRCTFVLEPMIGDLGGLGCGPEIAETMAKFVGENVWFSQVSMRAEMDPQREERATLMPFRQTMAVVFDATRRSQELANTRYCSSFVAFHTTSPLQMGRVSKQAGGTEYSNLKAHLAAKHAGYQTSFEGSSGRSLQSYGFVSEEASHLFQWIQWIIMRNMPIHEVEDALTRAMSKLRPVTVKAVKKCLEGLAIKVGLKLEKGLGTRFGLIWQAPRGLSPLADGSQTADAHVKLFENTLDVYDKSKEMVGFLVGDNCNTNQAFSNKLDVPFVGCAIHRLNLAVNKFLAPHESLLSVVNTLMVELQINKVKAVEETIPTGAKLQNNIDLFEHLKKLESICLRLQCDDTDMTEATANIVYQAAFETGVVKVINGSLLASAETLVLKPFEATQTAGKKRKERDEDYASQLLRSGGKKRKPTSDMKQYMPLVKMIPPASNIMQRLFSQ
ncbi:hypothetical protein JG688_00010319 [Phytophthora aleatoria]|uniref:Uncharacterized protein n=1 Tax=Phytophthora aleatoria TaxID=2496075 RepID=A0A8J5M1S4_9STRA|nr:hypothetical protein JG688_00010319 [Phytophthora aleatoria]